LSSFIVVDDDRGDDLASGARPATKAVERMTAAAMAWLYAMSCPAYNLTVQGRSEMLIEQA
jgi:hypothetical protein